MIKPYASDTGTGSTTSMMTHPYAELFPMMGERELQELADDIKANEQRDPIITYEGKILDGRSLYLACGMAGVEPRFEEWSGNGSLVRYVWSKNFTRRHLNSSQRAAAMMAYDSMLAKEARERMSRGAKLTIPKAVANLPTPDGDDASAVTALADDEKGRTRETLAEIANVSPRLIQDAKRVRAESPEMFEQLKTGELTVNAAMKRIKDSRDPDAPKRARVVDPVSELVGGAQALKKIALEVAGLTADQCRNAAGLAKAINKLGFAFSQLVPALVRTGDEDAIELARKTIAALAIIPLEPNPDGPQSGSRVQPAASTSPTSPTPPAASECAAGTPSKPIDPAALDWPQTAGMKIVMDAHVLKQAIKRASLAAMTKEGQSEFTRSSNGTTGCVRISAADGNITFESSVSMMSVRHVVPVGGDAVIVSEGETCVPGKELKVVAGKFTTGSKMVSLAFMPIPPDPTAAPSKATKATKPDGVVEIGSINGDRVIAKTKVDAYPAESFAAPQYHDESDLTVLMAGKAASVRGPYGLVSFCINPTDPKEIYNNLAIFTAPDSVYFLGSDGRRCASVQAKADSFDRMLGAETDAPVLVDAVFMSPVLATLGDADPIVVGIDKDAQKFYVISGQTTYCISMVASALRMKYPSYKRLIDLQTGAAFLINRKDLSETENLLLLVNEKWSRHTFAAGSQTVTMVARGFNAVKDATGSARCNAIGDLVLKGETIGLQTTYLVEGLKKMKADNVKLSFTPDELKVKIEDETDPKFTYYLQVMNPNDT